MSRYLKSIYKKSRQLGLSLLESNKEFSVYKKRRTRPGMHGKKKIKYSVFANQLREKQKAKFMYGLTEKQQRKYFVKATKLEGNVGENFLFLLESRLDNLVFRAGFATTRAFARQLVNHKNVLVNGKVIGIPSYIVSVNDVITIKEKMKKNTLVLNSIENQSNTLPFITVNKNNFSAKFLRLPLRTELNENINEVLIVEWYNRFV